MLITIYIHVFFFKCLKVDDIRFYLHAHENNKLSQMVDFALSISLARPFNNNN